MKQHDKAENYILSLLPICSRWVPLKIGLCELKELKFNFLTTIIVNKAAYNGT